jgi:hypothetical protein
MGWGICFDLDTNGRVYCVDGCKWRASKSDYSDYYPWPSALQSVLDYFEGEARRELDMIRDEFPGTAEGLKEACEEHIGLALREYDSLTAEERMNLHLEKMKELENEMNSLEEQKKILYDRYIQSRKAFKDYKPQTKKPKTRIDEIEIIIKPLNLELNMELAAREYDGCKLALTRTKRSLKLEKLFKSF